MIRDETVADADAIDAVITAAFGGEGEARLVRALRAGGGLLLSLVAERSGAIAGHVAFSAVEVIVPDQSIVAGVGLAPLAVAPAHQRGGIGTELVGEGLARLRAAGHRFCVVVGHPSYYARFGFVPTRPFGLRWEHGRPDTPLQAVALAPQGMSGVTGLLRYRPEFDALA